MAIHTYAREESGSLRYGTHHGLDLGGPITVEGPVEPLTGWPTPAMRAAVDGSGTPCAWYVGTDEAGRILPVRPRTA